VYLELLRRLALEISDAMASLLALAHDLRDGWNYGPRVGVVASALCVSALYLKFVVARVAPGLSSFILLAPVLALNVWLPLLFQVPDEIITATMTTFLVTWLASFKASLRLQYLLQQGPCMPFP
jgi:hypothetical protein